MILGFTSEFIQKKRLLIYLEADELSLVLTLKGKVVKNGVIFLREASRELIHEKVAAFMEGAKPSESLLILPRSEVLQKELVFSGESVSLKERVERKLEEVLPYSRKEMAYGFSLDQDGGQTQGLLLALPEKRLKEKLEFLGNIGLKIDEIITEDQALLWIKDEKGVFLLMDSEKRRILSLCGRKDRLLFSRSFPRKPEDPNELYLEEISLVLLERGLKPERLFLTGLWTDETQNELSRHFNCPIEKVGKGAEIPAWAEGALSFGTHSYLSLLPEAEKIRKRNQEKKKLLLQAFGSFTLFFAGLVLSFLVHLHVESHHIKKLEAELIQLLPGVKAAKEIQASLNLLNEAQDSKEKLLRLLRDLALKIPTHVKVKEISIGPKDFFFKGEASSHGFISETVDILSQCQSLKEVKLEQTRLRKKLNEEYFEFEVTGKWVS